MKTTPISLLALGICFLITSCDYPRLRVENEMLKAQIKLLGQENAVLPDQQSAGTLTHIVLLQLKETLTPEERKEVANLLQTLETIEEVQTLVVGFPEDTGDTRAIQDYNLVLQMTFADKEALAAYQVNEFHAKVREEAKQYQGGPPKILDYSTN